MKTTNLIILHEEAIELLMDIKHAENRQRIWIDALNGIAQYFSVLVRKYTHNLEITDMAIERLWSRYNKLIAKIQQL
jgi:hypothetical protein